MFFILVIWISYPFYIRGGHLILYMMIWNFIINPVSYYHLWDEYCLNFILRRLTQSSTTYINASHRLGWGIGVGGYRRKPTCPSGRPHYFLTCNHCRSWGAAVASALTTTLIESEHYRKRSMFKWNIRAQLSYAMSHSLTLINHIDYTFYLSQNDVKVF